ncbi:MAG: VOC family protein [bacterium]
MTDSNLLGSFVWYDLGTTDVEAAQTFYEAVAGWKLVPHNDQYMMFAGPRGPLGGAMLLSDEAKAMGAPPHWLAYIGTPDVDATIAQIRAMDGKVYVPAFDMPNVGRIAVVADSQGAVFGLFRPESGGSGGAGPGGGRVLLERADVRRQRHPQGLLPEALRVAGRGGMDMGHGHLHLFSWRAPTSSAA